MPTKRNGQGNQQPYIPKGNGDKSGEFTDEDKSTTQIANIKKELGYKEEPEKYKIGTKLDNSTLVDKVDINNEDMLQSTLQAYYDWLAEEPIEHNIIIDKYGNIWHTAGDEGGVKSSNKIDLDGAIDIHNHANYPHSFSKRDLNSAFNNKNTNFLLVDKDYIYKIRAIKRPSLDFNSYYNQGLEDAIKNGSDYKEQEHYAMLNMQKEGLVYYERKPRNETIK